jgi:hypothetical protein
MNTEFPKIENVPPQTAPGSPGGGLCYQAQPQAVRSRIGHVPQIRSADGALTGLGRSPPRSGWGDHRFRAAAQVRCRGSGAGEVKWSGIGS